MWLGQIAVEWKSERRKEILRAIGIAGIVAEDVLCEPADEAAMALEQYHWDFRFDYQEAMSESDWRLCAAVPEIDADELAKAATQVASLFLGPLRGELIKTARRLIVEARDPNTLIN